MLKDTDSLSSSLTTGFRPAFREILDEGISELKQTIQKLGENIDSSALRPSTQKLHLILGTAEPQAICSPLETRLRQLILIVESTESLRIAEEGSPLLPANKMRSEEAPSKASFDSVIKKIERDLLKPLLAELF